MGLSSEEEKGWFKVSYNIGMISLGCEKNRVDAELMLGKIKCEKYKIVSDLAKADAVIVNTCGFIRAAKEESIDEILSLVKIKLSKKARLKHIIVTGCLAQRYKEELVREVPSIDGIIGIGSNGKIKEALDKVFKNEKVSLFSKKEEMPMDGERVLTTPKYFAYLKIADGCDNFCSYCAIPVIRGRFRSRHKEEIINEAKNLVKRGVKELLVIAQDTTRYGEDLYGKLELPALLRELCQIENLHWIRLMYCYPERITDELLDLIEKEDKILNYIDIPLQHCDKRILEPMNRRGDRKWLENLIRKMRDKIPNLVLRTTFICGFPGEGEEEFNELKDFVSKLKFDRVGCFAYSREEGTKAFGMSGQVDEEIREKRCMDIMKIQEKIAEEKGKSIVGKTIEVLTEGIDEETGFWFGRGIGEAPEVDGKIFFTINEKSAGKNLEGKFVMVKVEEYDDYNLIGRMEEYPEVL